MHDHFWPKKGNLVATVKTHLSSLALAVVALATIIVVTLPVAVVILSCAHSCRVRSIHNHLWPPSPSPSPIPRLCLLWCSPFLHAFIAILFFFAIFFLFSSFLFPQSALLLLVPSIMASSY